MLIAPAMAQAGGAAPGGADLVSQLIPLLLIFAIFYFLIIRPQQKRMRQHREMIGAVRRGDIVVTSGGIVGKVTKVFEGDEIQVEIAENVRVKVLKTTLTDVRGKTEPVAAGKKSAEKPARQDAVDKNEAVDVEPDEVVSPSDDAKDDTKPKA